MLKSQCNPCSENFGYEGFSFLMCWTIPDKREKSVAGGYWSPECDLVSATNTQRHSLNFSEEQSLQDRGFRGFSCYNHYIYIYIYQSVKFFITHFVSIERHAMRYYWLGQERHAMRYYWLGQFLEHIFVNFFKPRPSILF